MGTPEIILICIVLIVVFGATKLPQLGDGLGRAIKNFKRAVNTGSEIEVSPKKAELGNTERAPDAEVSPADKKTTAAK